MHQLEVEVTEGWCVLCWRWLEKGSNSFRREEDLEKGEWSGAGLHSNIPVLWVVRVQSGRKQWRYLCVFHVPSFLFKILNEIVTQRCSKVMQSFVVNHRTW
jgi:hypothetical protein